MKVKDLKEVLSKFNAEDEVIVHIGFKRKGVIDCSNMDFSGFEIQESLEDNK